MGVTNSEWLKSLDPNELKAWFEAEHVDANDDLMPKTDVTAASVDANDGTVTTMPLKVPSETIVNGERVRGIPKIGWSGQTAEKMDGLVDSKPIHATQATETDNYTAEVGNGAQTTREAAENAIAAAVRELNAEFTDEDIANGERMSKATPHEPYEPQDSREKLEADVESIVLATVDKYWEQSELHGAIMNLLDRQAAISEREQREWWGGVVAELQERVDNLCVSEEIGNKLINEQLERIAEQDRRIVEYAVKVDELKAELESKNAQLDEILRCGTADAALNEKLAGERDELQAKVDELTYENNRLAHNLGETLADRDEYRALVGQMLDAAQEIRRIADANIPSGARVVVDLDGEVVT